MNKLYLYVLEREGFPRKFNYVEQTIVAHSDEEVLKIAEKQLGKWRITKKILLEDIKETQIITQHWIGGDYN